MSKKNKTYWIGIVSVISPLPMILITCIWAEIFIIGFGIGILKYDTIPNWINIISLIPLGFSPLFDCFGIVYGFINRKEKASLICIILSIVGLLENFILIYGIYFLGSRF
jgi:hypothetical protein